MSGKVRATSFVLIAILVGAILSLSQTTAATTNNSAPQITNLTDGRIFRVEQGSSWGFDISAQDVNAGDTVTISVDSPLPPSSRFTTQPGNPAQGTFTWAQPQDSWQVSFVARDDNNGVSGRVTVMIVAGVQSQPTVEFDKNQYVTGQKAKITVRDVFADQNYKQREQVIVNVTSDTDASGIPVVLKESIEERGVFSGHVNFTNSASNANSGLLQAGATDDLEVAYQGETGFAVSNAKMSPVGIKFDKSHYTKNSQAKITVTDAISPFSTNAVNEVSVKIKTSTWNQVKTVLLQETGANTRIFKGTIIFKPPASAGFTLIPAGAGTVIVANYTVLVDNEPFTALASAMLAPKPFMSFDKSTYTTANLPEIRAYDISKNTNSSKADSFTVKVTSTSDPVGINMLLLENGPDTGMFFSATKLQLTPGSSNDTMNVLYVEPTDLIKATYSGINANAAITPLPLELLAAELAIAAETGIGETGTPTEGVPLYDIQVVNCSPYGGDGDHDGICRDWERAGEYQLRIPYPEGGSYYTILDSCTPCPSDSIKDIYVEIDYVDGQRPLHDGMGTDLGLAAIRDMFNAKNIKFHYYINHDVDADAYSEGYNMERIKIWNGNPATPQSPWSASNLAGFIQIKDTYFGSPTERAEFGGTGGNYLSAKRQVFHYALFAKYQDHAPGSSGISEFVGNDFIVSLGSFPHSLDQEKGTFLHELGHNLGLNHGGGLHDNNPADGHPDFNADGVAIPIPDHAVNCKPNYISAMSYIRQFTNPFNVGAESPTPTSYAGDPLYVPNQPVRSDQLITNSLNEPNGIRTASGSQNIAYGYDLQGVRTIKNITISTTTGAIDWNVNNNDQEQNLVAQLVNLGFAGCDAANYNTLMGLPVDAGKMSGFNDWSSLVLDFRFHTGLGLGTFSTGVQTTAHPEEITIDTVRDLRVHGLIAISEVIRSFNNTTFDDPANANDTKSELYGDLFGQTVYYLPAALDDTGSRVISFQDPDDNGNGGMGSGGHGGSGGNGGVLPPASGGIAALLQQDKLLEGLDKLIEFRQKMDGSRGGSSLDDVIVDVDAQRAVLSMIDANIISINTELNLYESELFTLTGEYDGTTYTIYGKSSMSNVNGMLVADVTPVSNTFTINPEESIEDIDLQGNGTVHLTIENELIRMINLTMIEVDGDDKAFRVVSSNSSHTTIQFVNPEEGSVSIILINETVVPEFPVALVMLAVALTAIIGFTLLVRSRSGLFFGRT